FRSSNIKGSGEGSSGKDIVEHEQRAVASVEKLETQPSSEPANPVTESSEEYQHDEEPKQLSDDIDSLIAMELAKREKETEELNRKKKSVQEESIEDILNDAVRQAEEKINHSAEHVDQNDLDALIAMELAKREAETEEMVRRKKEAEKKNEFLEDLESVKKDDEVLSDIPKVDEQNNLIVKVDSVSEIRELAKKIIKGEERDISIDVKGELGEIIRLIKSTKEKVDSLEPGLELSSQNVPNVTKTLEYVNSTTEEATANLIQYCDDLTSIYSELSEHFREVEKYIENGNKEMTLDKIGMIDSLVSKAEEIGFNILQALEFQDITEQKINRVIKNVEEIGARLGAILGYVVASGSIVDEAGASSQDDIDKLLSDFGLN
ncbi:MAG: protein phosphatase CheZ, partial [Calditerrivibrio sp.]|nr:protein phosphatase CheZ [Calditerrivibrio sp.]